MHVRSESTDIHFVFELVVAFNIFHLLKTSDQATLVVAMHIMPQDRLCLKIGYASRSDASRSGDYCIVCTVSASGTKATAWGTERGNTIRTESQEKLHLFTKQSGSVSPD